MLSNFIEEKMTLGVLEISTTLELLIKQAGISEAELARKINVPRATINRLASGRTPDPRASTINAIAKYFNVSVDQLLGGKPLFINIGQSITEDSLMTIPILNWSETKNWEEIIKTLKPNQDYESIIIDPSIEQGKFAIKIIGDAMWPQFQENSILIIDPYKESNNRDFVIAYIKKNDEVVFRQLFVEGKFKFLKAINNIFPSIELQNSDKIIGIIIQTRKNF